MVVRENNLEGWSHRQCHETRALQDQRVQSVPEKVRCISTERVDSFVGGCSQIFVPLWKTFITPAGKDVTKH